MAAAREGGRKRLPPRELEESRRVPRRSASPFFDGHDFTVLLICYPESHESRHHVRLSRAAPTLRGGCEAKLDRLFGVSKVFAA